MNRIALLIAGGLALAAAPAAAQSTWTWNGPVRPGQMLEIKGVNGAIHATATTGSEVRVRVVKNARRSNPDDVQMVVLPHAGGVTICAVYPHVRGREPNECVVGRGGRNNVQNNDVSVEWEVQVPAGVNLTALTVNGGIQASGLTGNLVANTVNGAITLTTNGIARATTVNGSIDATLGRTDWSGELEFTTTNGSVTVTVPGNLNANVRASTVTGSIDTDFPLEVRGRFMNRNLQGTVGSGGRDLTMTTVNGRIALRQR